MAEGKRLRLLALCCFQGDSALFICGLLNRVIAAAVNHARNTQHDAWVGVSATFAYYFKHKHNLRTE